MLSIVRTRLASPWQTYSGSGSIRGGSEGSSRSGSWPRFYTCLPRMPCSGYQQALCYVMGSNLFQFLLYLLSVYGLGQIRYDRTKKRRLSHWIFCYPLLRYVRAHGSPHVSLSENKTDTTWYIKVESSGHTFHCQAPWKYHKRALYESFTIVNAFWNHTIALCEKKTEI